MKYIVFDTEFTSWEGSQENNWSKKGEHRELVQIGAYKIHNGEIIDTLNLFIKPRINPLLSKYFIDLTGITNKKINKDGLNFFIAMEQFYKFTNDVNYIYSYGNDYGIIEENMILNNVPINSKFFKKSWKSKFFDFKILLDDKINTNNYTSGTIYKAFDIKMDDNHKIHNALDDSYSLYLVSKKIIK